MVTDPQTAREEKRKALLQPIMSMRGRTLSSAEHDLDSLKKIGLTPLPKTNPISTAKAIPYSICVCPPFSPHWLYRILGGQEACPHCWPCRAGVRFLGDHQCGGAIIHPVWILMAAYCVKSTIHSSTIIAGDNDRTLKKSTEQVRRAIHIVHEDFDVVTYVSSPVEYSSAVRPVCLPESMELLFSSEICAVTGWGSTTEDGGPASLSQQIQVPVIERAVCVRTHHSAYLGGITDKMLCAGFIASRGKDCCQRDLGGPVCKHNTGPFVLCSIISLGAGCVPLWKPGMTARVKTFLDWVQSKIKGPASLQIKNKSKILTKQLLPPTPSTDSLSGPGIRREDMTQDLFYLRGSYCRSRDALGLGKLKSKRHPTVFGKFSFA
ncbi:LOW QUALITY PROTEIN: ovochymase-1-like [Erethizon dorsatum]